MKNNHSRIYSFFYGLTLPIKALSVILSNRKLMIWSAAPIGVTLIIYLFLIQSLQKSAHTSLQHLFERWSLDPTGWTFFIFSSVTKIILLLVSTLTFSSVSLVIACPFNDFLAEATEPLATPPMKPILEKTIRYRVRIIGIDLIKSVIATSLSLISLVMYWFPLGALIALLLNFYLMCFQFTSYPQTRRKEGIISGIHFLWCHRYSCLGFGIVITLLFAIPIISCLMLPLAVVGGTLLDGHHRHRFLNPEGDTPPPLFRGVTPGFRK